MSYSRFFLTVIQRDLLLAWQQRGDLLVGLVFFVLVASLFPLAVGPEPQLLARIGPGVLWVAAILANLLALPRLFHADWQDGTLEQLLLAPAPASVMVAGKLIAHWLSTGVPLTLIAPLLGIQYGLEADALLMLMATLLIGTPTLSALGSVGAALTLGVRQGEMLLALLALPLYAPVLIFGSGAVAAVSGGLTGYAELSLLAAILCGSLFLAPWLAAMAMRLAVE
ncbi:MULTISPECIES: heme exporter protein CcmB [Deefgea]|uniref:Heme exporter protein B n=1 Tax=Deefgea chitinilytica TaxID=570276 RepID=A0ABS2CC24_9NEIS|nr:MULTISPECIES: heme exporter protein CcmB [Deefgea]MBM5571698.1 heme exporter protein CcmB [Deefgea chitinilytica]MBM9888933.1 heme exporter protein CcmB [Deefgea sp. CFH1-16]